MRSNIQWKGNMQFEAQGDSSGHKLVLDAAEEVGGENKGSRPMEVVLHGLGVCTGIDILLILKKMRIDIEDYRMEIKGERADHFPKRFTDIHIHFEFKGNIPRAKLTRAVQLSKDKYCSVSHSLNANITYDIELNGEKIKWKK